MSTRVHVILSGIVSLIPSAGTPTTWTVRLHNERSNPDHPHFPSILVEHDNLTSAPAPDLSKTLPSGTILDAWWLVDGEISVKSAILDSTISSPSPLPYTLSIERACGGVPKCPIAKPFNGVSMTVVVGSLEATELEDNMWQWDASPPPVWIAEEVCWKFEIASTELEIWLPYEPELKLKIGAPPRGDIELRLQNTMDLDVFPLLGAKPDIDPHAGLYFHEASANPGQQPVLRKHPPIGNKPNLPNHNHRLTDSKIGTRDPLVSLRVNCPPAQWKG